MCVCDWFLFLCCGNGALGLGSCATVGCFVYVGLVWVWHLGFTLLCLLCLSDLLVLLMVLLIVGLLLYYLELGLGLIFVIVLYFGTFI